MTRLDDVVTAALMRWAALTEPGEALEGWEVADGPFVGLVGDLVLTVGVSDGENAESYTVDVSDPDPSGGCRELGTIRCELDFRDGEGVSSGPARSAVVAALQALAADCEEAWPASGGPVDVRVGSHRWAHLQAEDGSSITSCAFELIYVAWI